MDFNSKLLQLGSSWTAADVSTEKKTISAEIGLNFWALTIPKAQKRINSTSGFRWSILAPWLQLDSSWTAADVSTEKKIIHFLPKLEKKFGP